MSYDEIGNWTGEILPNGPVLILYQEIEKCGTTGYYRRHSLAMSMIMTMAASMHMLVKFFVHQVHFEQ